MSTSDRFFCYLFDAIGVLLVPIVLWTALWHTVACLVFLAVFLVVETMPVVIAEAARRREQFNKLYWSR